VATKDDRERRRKSEADVLEYLRQRSEDVEQTDRRRRNTTITTVVGREVLFLEQLKTALREVFAEALAKPKVLAAKPKGKTKRILNAIISDTHFGSNLDPREVGVKFGPVEEARRMAAICRKLAFYKRQYRDETELFLHVIGDLFQGVLHDQRDGYPLAEQVAATVRIMVQVMTFLAREFPCGVTLRCVPGNHGRNKARHLQRATFQKWDAIEMHVYTALKEVSNFIPGVKVELGYEPKYDFPLFEEVGFATHGDTVLNVGSPNKTVDVANLTKQINAINAARISKGKKPYRVFIVGHVHIATMIHLPGNIVVFTNGPLIPPDSFANSIGVFDGTCGQWMWEAMVDHHVGDARFINVDEATDKDASLDLIIKPFTGL
jgi:hypothetical protein